MAEDYTDIQIRVRRWNEAMEAYPVEATLDDGSFFGGGELHLNQEALLVARLTSQAYGLDLFDALVSGRIRRAYHKVTGRAESETEGRVRVRLWIDEEAAELHAIPWERIYHNHRGQDVPVATSTLTPFSRYTGLEIAEAQPVTERPIRLLFAIANPSDLPGDLPAIDVEEEVENLRQALGDLRRQGQVQVTLLHGRTPLSPELRAALEGDGYQIEDGATSLDNILRLLPGCHVLHFLGHGHFRREGQRGGGTAALHLEQADGTWVAVKDEDLVGKLTNIDPQPHLVFLAACESAQRGVEGPFVGLGPKLVEAGIPAVVAMQDKVGMDVARQLTGDFYRRLLEHGAVDRALNEARNLLFEEEQVDWAIPVLFMRLETGQLLTANPVRAALEAIQKHDDFSWFAPEKGIYIPFPIEVIHLTDRQDFRGFDQMETETTAAIDILKAVESIWESPLPENEKRLIVLIGGYGSNKSTQLKRLVWETTQKSLRSQDKGTLLPVYVDLESFSTVHLRSRQPIKELVLESLRPYWTDLTASTLDRLLKDGTSLRLLFDDSERLNEGQRREVHQKIRSFISRHPQHQYMLSTTATSFGQELFTDLKLDMLIIQPLRRRRIRHLLRGLSAVDKDLLERLDRYGLFDLAAVPWFLFRMVRRAREERQFPESRTQVLQQVIEELIATTPRLQGMQAPAEEVLYALAWQMQSTLSTTMPLTEVFAIMRRVRGNREYDLEELCGALVQSRLLAHAGMDSVRFAYSRFRAYCCAKAIVQRDDRDRVLDDITASLGRLTRLHWWEETLTFACGLLADDAKRLERLLSIIVYGVNLLESEQAFLAARCFMEGRRQRPGRLTKAMRNLNEQVTTALIWRLSNRNEPRSSHRSRAALLLGQLVDDSAFEHLARVSYEKARYDRHGELDFDYSNVRMAAVIGLLRMDSTHRKQFLRDRIDPVLVELLESWQNRQVKPLIEWLHSPSNSSAQAIAALALGDLHMLEAEQEREAEDALCALADAFLGRDTGPQNLSIDPETLWAIAYALAMIDLPRVKQAVIDPFFREEFEPSLAQGIGRSSEDEIGHFLMKRSHLFGDRERRILHYKCMAYLIGLLRWQEGRAYDFLVELCLKGSGDVRLAAVAIDALGRLADQRHKPLLESIALGRFDPDSSRPAEAKPEDRAYSVGLSWVAEAKPEDQAYLRRKAIDALASVGDLDTVTELRSKCRERRMRVQEGMEGETDRPDWTPALEQALYRTSEEIYWRLNWDLHL